MSKSIADKDIYTRLAQVRADGVWQEVPFESIQEGQIFRLFDPVVYKGETEFTADTNARIDNDGRHVISIRKGIEL